MKVVITGASRGIGKALAESFAAQSAHDLLLISRNESALSELCDGIGDRSAYLAVDLTLSQDISRVSDYVAEHWGQVDVLINNAGALVNKQFEQISRTEFEEVIAVNYTSVFFLIQGLLPYLKKSERAHVVNIGSMGGVQGSSKFAGLSVYSSSKAAIAGLSECLAVDLAEFGISVNCLALGSVQTEMLSAAFPGYLAETRPEEMASFIRDWSLGAGRLVSGKVIPVAGVGI